MKLFLVLTSLMFMSLSAKAHEVVVLIPGFFNSFTPEYFSQDIVNSFTKKGVRVYVANKLNGIGTIEDNGSRVETLLKSIEQMEGGHVEFNIVAHSAGGFYSLWVANRHNFSIKNIYTVSTPYLGVEFIQTWIDNCMLFSALTSLAKLESLRQLTPAGAQKFLQSIRINPKTRIFAFGGTQDESFDVTDSRNLPAALLVTSHYITNTSDGIVAFRSAMGVGAIQTTEGKMAAQYTDRNFRANLDHMEQVLPADSLILMGIRNPDYIRREQIRFYSGLADLVVKTM